MRTTLVPALLALILGACSQSHGSCVGEEAPRDLCHTGWSGSSDCCLEGGAVSMECGATGWECPAGTFARDACRIVDRACEGVDAGPPIDAGPSSCLGPTPLCYPGYGGAAACCLDTPVPAACVGSTFECPAAHFRFDECGRVDAACEGIDAGSSGGLYDDCNVNSDCVLAPVECCAPCGRSAATDLAAVNEARAGAYRLDVACPEARDGELFCEPCDVPPEPGAHLLATCDMRGVRPACALVDLATAPYASCDEDTDCRLAVAECCACGEVPVADTIAIAGGTSIDALLCDAELPCPPCVAAFEPSLRAVCISGLCQVAAD